MESQTPDFNFNAPEREPTDSPYFKLTPNLELPEDLMKKENIAEKAYGTMKDPVAKELALLLAKAAIASANDLNVNTGDKTYQQVI